MLALTLAWLAAAQAPVPAPLDEGPVVDAVETALAAGVDIVRIAIPPIDDADVTRRGQLERALVRAIRDRQREEVVTPALLRAQLNQQADGAQSAITVEQLKPYACDHMLLASVITEGDSTALRLRLVKVETGQVLAESSARLGAADAASSVSGANVRVATDELVEQIAYAVESRGTPVATHRIGVPALNATPGAAADSRLDRFVQAELQRSLLRRGFLVAERSRIDEAVQQLALGQALGEDNAPQVGKLAGVDSVVVGSVSEAGTAFLVNLRVVDVNSGAVVGAASAQLPRDDVVARADVETRTPLEAGVRSAVAPGWGQAYNGQGAKALAFGIGGYGGLLGTVGLGVASAVSYRSYLDVKPGSGVSASEASAQAEQLRGVTDALLVSTAIAAGVTVVVWGAGIVDALISSPADGGGA